MGAPASYGWLDRQVGRDAAPDINGNAMPEDFTRDLGRLATDEV